MRRQRGEKPKRLGSKEVRSQRGKEPKSRFSQRSEGAKEARSQRGEEPERGGAREVMS